MADAGNRRIRQVSLAGFVTTIAGSGDDGAKDGLALEASFRTPVGVTVASDGTIFVIDATAYEIRAITPDRSTVYTVAGVDFGACNPTPLKDQPAPSPPAGLKCAEPYTQLLRNGDARDALFDQPSSAVVLPDGSLLVADSGNHAFAASLMVS